MSDTPAFDRMIATLEYPMFVVSAAADGEADACLVGFTTQCSIDPPRFVVFLSKANRTYQLARRTTTLVVHRVGAHQHDLAEHFGGTSKYDEPDKLAKWSWRPGPRGAPVIDECDWFAGTIVNRFDGGDHVAFVLEPLAGAEGGESHGANQLGSKEAADIDAGRPP